MVLEKPQNEECGNCRFCISQLVEYAEGRGFFENPSKKTVERFWCHRNAPLCNFEGHITGTGDITLKPSQFSIVNAKGWCGEWKERK